MIYGIDGQELFTKDEIESLFPPIDESHAPYMQCFDKITGIGDSLMAGYTATPTMTVNSATARARKANWLSYMGADLGREPVNLAVGNTTTHDWRYGEDNADITLANIDTNCYLIGLGVNDSRQSSVVVGTTADIKSTVSQNGDTFYGNMDFIVRTLHGYNSDAHIFLFTIPGSETKKVDINIAINYIANLYQYVHCIDLDAKYADYYTDGFINDNLYSGHFNPIAYRLMASYVERALNEFIHDNYQLFKNIPYQL